VPPTQPLSPDETLVPETPPSPGPAAPPSSPTVASLYLEMEQMRAEHMRQKTTNCQLLVQITGLSAQLAAATEREKQLAQQLDTEREAKRRWREAFIGEEQRRVNFRERAQLQLNQRLTAVQARLGVHCAANGCPVLEAAQAPMMDIRGCRCTVARHVCTHCFPRLLSVDAESRLVFKCPMCAAPAAALAVHADSLLAPSSYTLPEESDSEASDADN
jgi:hypothetical protein